MKNKFLLAIMLSASVTVVSCSPKDADVKTAIENSVAADATLSGVTVEVREGVATLSGEVGTEGEKAIALGKAKETKGVKSVQNNIVVTPPFTSDPVIVASDAALEAGMRDLTKDLSSVKYAVKDGVITLTGELTKAQNMAFTQAYMALNPVRVDRTGFL